MELKLERLKIRNFKGIDAFDFEPQGRSAYILGDNGTGKSTVYDAYSWLLFGCDSRGNSQFDIEPRDETGAVRDPEAVTEVTCVFRADEQELILRKRCLQKWVRVRGRSELTYQGNANEYEVNGVPCTKGEYEEKLAALCDTPLLKILSNVYAFPSLPWQDQRAMLSGLTGEEDDLAVMASAGHKYDSLSELMIETDSSLDEVMKMVERDRRLTVQAQNTLPAIIDENKRYVSSGAIPDTHGLKTEQAQIMHRIDSLTQRRTEANSDEAYIAAKTKLAAAEAEINALNRENEAYKREQRALWEAAHNVDGIKARITDAGERQQAAKKRINDCVDEVKRLEASLTQLRGDYAGVMGEQYSGEDTCPRCGRKYDKKTIDKAVEYFEAEKKERLARMAASGKEWNARLREANAELEKEKIKLDEADHEIGALADRLTGEKFEASDMDVYAEKMGDLETYQGICADEAEAAGSKRDETVKELDREIAEARNELNEVNRKIGEAEREAAVRARIIELEHELKDKAALAAHYDDLIALAADFGMYKAQRIEDGINALFGMVRFKLFENQKNGGLRFCCEATVDGIGFNRNLNTSARINAGIDIINAFAGRYNVLAPVFVDNGESVTNLRCYAGQLIILEVKAGQDELEVVECN